MKKIPKTAYPEEFKFLKKGPDGMPLCDSQTKGVFDEFMLHLVVTYALKAAADSAARAALNPEESAYAIVKAATNTLEALGLIRYESA